MLREGLFDHHRLDPRLMTAAGGTPTAQDALGPVPEGYAWYIENIAWSVVGNSHNALLDFAVTVDNGQLPTQALWDHAGLIATFTSAAIRGALQPGLPFYVPPNHFIRAYAAGGSLAAGDVVAVTYQIAVHQLNPRQMMSPDDIAQARAAHQHPTAEVSETAVAGRRAY